MHKKPKVIFIERKTEHFEKPNNQNTKNKTKSHFPASPTSNLPFFTIYNLKHANLLKLTPLALKGDSTDKIACFKFEL